MFEARYILETYLKEIKWVKNDMNIIILGAAGFIGTNLIMELSKENKNIITAVDRDVSYFDKTIIDKKNIIIKESTLSHDIYFDELLYGQDVVYHLVSTTIPTTSNLQISQELVANVVFTSNMLEACVRNKIKKVVFISSGGTVYGKEAKCPLKEDTPTNPISSYGVQKITIEKLLYLYRYMHGIDYRIIRLANPYGPYQRPNGQLGVITTFVYRALKGDKITVYGDGSVVRDYIYIDDAVRAIINIVEKKGTHKTYNLGCGYGTSVNDIITAIENTLNIELKTEYISARKVDVPINYLDISRYEDDFGKLLPVNLQDGIIKTAEFLKNKYNIS